MSIISGSTIDSLNDSLIAEYPRVIRVFLFFVLATVTLVGLGGCGSKLDISSLQTPLDTPSSALPSEPPAQTDPPPQGGGQPPPGPGPGGGTLVTQALTIHQVKGIADILVIMDNSQSMKDEQANMANRFQSFIGELSSIDWRLAIITTDIAKDAPLKDGRFVEFVGAPGTYAIDSYMEAAQADTLFKSTIKVPETGVTLENGIFAAYRALERIDTDSVHAAFFRPDSLLSFIVVSDEDESGKSAKDDPNNLFSYVKQRFGSEKIVSFNSIITIPGDKTCKAANGRIYGEIYAMASLLTGGIIGSICADDYGSQLSMIGKDTAEKVRTVQLKCTPISVESQPLLLVLDGQGHPITNFVVEDNRVTFADYLAVGNYTLNYYCP